MPLIIKGRNLVGTGPVPEKNPVPETKNTSKPADEALKAKIFQKIKKPEQSPAPVSEIKQENNNGEDSSSTSATLKKRFGVKKKEKISEEPKPNQFNVKSLFNKNKKEPESTIIAEIEPIPVKPSLEKERLKRKEENNQKSLNIIVQPTSEEQVTLKRSFVIEKNKLKGVASAESRLVVNGKERKIGRKSNYLLDMLTLDDE